MYLKCSLYWSLKYSATVIFLLRPVAKSSTSNCSFSAETLDTPHTVYFLLIVAAWVVWIRTPDRQRKLGESALIHTQTANNGHMDYLFIKVMPLCLLWRYLLKVIESPATQACTWCTFFLSPALVYYLSTKSLQVEPVLFSRPCLSAVTFLLSSV